LLYTPYGEDISLEGYDKKSSQWRNFVLQAFLNYSRTFGKHGIDAVFMAGYEDNTTSSASLPFRSIDSGGRLAYNYNKKYTGEFSFGYSGDDNYSRGNRFGFFPSGAVAWLLSEEEFLKGNEMVDNLKLRVSYGLTGNKNTGSRRFPYIQNYTGQNYYLGTTNASIWYLLENYLADKNATWEKAKKANIGFDASFLNNALSVSFDYFQENRYDILTIPYDAIPSYWGFSLSDLNIGKVDNKGFEAVVRYNAPLSKNSSYFIEASAWYAKNKITYNAEAPQLYDYQYRTGLSIGTPFMLEAAGFYNESDFNADGSLKDGLPVPVFETVRPGDLKYKNQNQDNVIDNNDLVPVGYSTLPELTLALRAGATCKNFDVEMLFQGAVNRTVYWGGNYFHAFQNDGQISTVALGRWTPETASTATYPRLSANNNMNNYQPSSFWQKNGNFLKLRNMEIGYSLPNRLPARLNIEKVRMFLNVANLFSLDYMEGFTDPEALTGYPAIRVFSAGLSIQF
jgi:TonB-linked SusC/RagA family outer membrane protein